MKLPLGKILWALIANHHLLSVSWALIVSPDASTTKNTPPVFRAPVSALSAFSVGTASSTGSGSSSNNNANTNGGTGGAHKTSSTALGYRDGDDIDNNDHVVSAPKNSLRTWFQTVLTPSRSESEPEPPALVVAPPSMAAGTVGHSDTATVTQKLQEAGAPSSSSMVTHVVAEQLALLSLASMLVAVAAGGRQMLLSPDTSSLLSLPWDSFSTTTPLSLNLPLAVLTGSVAAAPLIFWTESSGSSTSDASVQQKRVQQRHAVNALLASRGNNSAELPSSSVAATTVCEPTPTHTVLGPAALVSAATAATDTLGLVYGISLAYAWTGSHAAAILLPAIVLAAASSAMTVSSSRSRSSKLEEVSSSSDWSHALATTLTATILYGASGSLVAPFVCHWMCHMHTLMGTFHSSQQQLSYVQQRKEQRQQQQPQGSSSSGLEYLFDAFDSDHSRSLSVRDVHEAVAYAFYEDTHRSDNSRASVEAQHARHSRQIEAAFEESNGKRLDYTAFVKLIVQLRRQSVSKSPDHVSQTSA